MKRTLVRIALASCLVLGAGPVACPLVPPVMAQDDWKADFEDVCARTQDAMALTQDELKGLIERCDRLRPRIEKLDESAAKVYLKRLQMCRDLYVFVLESKSR